MGWREEKERKPIMPAALFFDSSGNLANKYRLSSL